MLNVFIYSQNDQEADEKKDKLVDIEHGMKTQKTF